VIRSREAVKAYLETGGAIRLDLIHEPQPKEIWTTETGETVVAPAARWALDEELATPEPDGLFAGMSQTYRGRAVSKRPRWSAWEDEQLRLGWAAMSPVENIAAAVGRSVSAVGGRASSLGLPKREIARPAHRQRLRDEPYDREARIARIAEIKAQIIPEIETRDDAYVAACNRLGGFKTLTEKAAMLGVAA